VSSYSWPPTTGSENAATDDGSENADGGEETELSQAETRKQLAELKVKGAEQEAQLIDVQAHLAEQGKIIADLQARLEPPEHFSEVEQQSPVKGTEDDPTPQAAAKADA
jgi:uncharacterized coiled-coil protein SlyX